MKKLILILLILASVPAASAQSLDSLLQLALDNNPVLKAEQSEVMAARAAEEVAGSIPNLEARGGYLVLPVEAPMGMQRMRLSVHQMLPPPGVLRYRTQAAEHTTRAREASSQNMTAEVMRDVRMLYFDLYGVQARIRSLEEQQANLQQLEPIALQTYSSGQAPMSQVIRLRASILELQKQQSQLQAQEKSLQSRLIALLNRPAMTPVITADTLKPIFEAATLQLKQNELQNHPQLQLIQQQYEAQRSLTQVNERMRLPEFGVGLEYMLMPDGMSGVMPMLSADIPLFRNRSKSMVRESRAMEDALSHRQEQALRSLEAMLGSSMQEWQAAHDNARFLQQQLELQRSLLRQMTTELSSGMSSLAQLLEEENSILMMQFELQEALVMLKKAEADLIYLTGSDYVER